MKTKLHLFLAALALILISGCATSRSEKLPAGDIDMFSEFKDEIATLHNTALTPNSKAKYDAALTLYRNVDFSYVRDLVSLERIFSARDAHLGEKNYEKQNVIFLYRYKDKRVRFVFVRFNNSIIHSECTDLIE